MNKADRRFLLFFLLYIDEFGDCPEIALKLSSARETINHVPHKSTTVLLD
jgi:hypothetical protein